VSILRLESFGKRFLIHQLNREVLAFEGIDATLEAGQLMLVAGANGAGKSTLLRCIHRTYRPSSGHAWFQVGAGLIDLATAADEDIAFLRKREIGYVAQFLRPRPRVSALELVAEPLMQSGFSRPRSLERAEEMLDTFGLKTELWQAYPSTFSGGEQQKVNLARALIRPRKLLLLDEPTASLDALARVALRSRIESLKHDGVALIGVFHHPEDMAGLIDSRLEIQGDATLREDNLEPQPEELLYVAQ
jgi:alpha-D-ribose 1-methylphosphonate 5-triphosphate synthase subunit PhnL